MIIVSDGKFPKSRKRWDHLSSYRWRLRFNSSSGYKLCMCYFDDKTLSLLLNYFLFHFHVMHCKLHSQNATKKILYFYDWTKSVWPAGTSINILVSLEILRSYTWNVIEIASWFPIKCHNSVLILNVYFCNKNWRFKLDHYHIFISSCSIYWIKIF